MSTCQVEGPLSGNERFAEQSRLPSDILQPIQLALDELKTSQASLQQALEGTGETSSTAAMSTGDHSSCVCELEIAWHIFKILFVHWFKLLETQHFTKACSVHADFVEQAARKAAKEVLREFSAQSPDTFELRETISATLTAVRQLEVATMERISSLASSISALPAGTLPTGVLKSLAEPCLNGGFEWEGLATAMHCSHILLLLPVGLSVNCAELSLCALIQQLGCRQRHQKHLAWMHPQKVTRAIPQTRGKLHFYACRSGSFPCFHHLIQLLLQPVATLHVSIKESHNTGHSNHVQALLREQNKKSSAEVASTLPDAAVAADRPNSDESKSSEDLVPISAWLGPRNGAAESMPEPEMAWDQSSNGAFASASTSQSIPKVSPEAPAATSSSATGNRASHTGDIPYTAAQAQEAETSAGPVQDSGWGQQGGNSAEEQGYYNRGQQPAGGSSSSSKQAAQPADIPASARGGYTGAAPLASNGNPSLSTLCWLCRNNTVKRLFALINRIIASMH